MPNPDETKEAEPPATTEGTKAVRLTLASGSVMHISGLDEEGMQKILELLPEDVRLDMATGKVDAGDKGFLDAVQDHVKELIAPAAATRKEVRKNAKELMKGFGPGTITNEKRTPGRNDMCFCGSGKKYKACHMRKKA